MAITNMAVIMIFGPLISALVAGLMLSNLHKLVSQMLTSSVMLLSSAIAFTIFYHVAIQGAVPVHISLLKWIEIDSLIANWAIYIDVLSSVMCLIITVISSVVHIYSIGYMSDDESPQRFMSYISLFTFFMLMLVCSDNFIQLFFGWEGVGLSSYLLIGFWFRKESAKNAAMKAFLVNRVGDIGLALGIFLIFYVFNSVEFSEVFANAARFSEDTIYIFDNDVSVITVICMLLFLGCMGKSAQIGLHTWLPDAMEGPTPVSALIHAATMVTAGVFMLARCSPIFQNSEIALQIITVIGAITAVFGAVIAVSQTDIKKIIAYSTCSQLGYMFFACGLSAYSAAIFHLATHAFFKALLFLSAGSVIHAINGEKDINRMGGIYNKIPFTYAMMWIGSLALAGIFPFSGFYSKDAILEAALNGTYVGLFAYVIGLLSAFLTALYSWRLIIMVFHGETKMNSVDYSNIHESRAVMLIPLIILSVGAVCSGWYGVDVLHMLSGDYDFWKNSIVTDLYPHVIHNKFLAYLPMLMGLLGASSAFFFYKTNIGIAYTKAIISNFARLYSFIKNKFYFDELYELIFVRTIKISGLILANYIDTRLIDSIPNGIAAISLGFSKILSKFQSGYLSNYVGLMILSGFAILFIALNGLKLLS